MFAMDHLDEFEEWLASDAFGDAAAQNALATPELNCQPQFPLDAVNDNTHRPPRSRKRSKAADFKEKHVIVERKRRQGMNEYFNDLSSLLPQTALKCDKLTIVSETIDFIHSLRNELEVLSKKREDISKGSASQCSSKESDADAVVPNRGQGTDAVVSVRGVDVFITLYCPKTISLLGLIKRASQVLEEHQLELVNGNTSTTSDSLGLSYYMHARSIGETGLGSPEALESALSTLTVDGKK